MSNEPEMAQTIQNSKPVLLIPAYKPGAMLPSVIREVLGSGAVQKVIVVDDGSGTEGEAVFRDVLAIEGVELIRHERNLGKGAAIKKGLFAISENYPECAGVVTADADGQHTPKDIIKVAEEMTENPGTLVLGVRDVALMPLRSKFGNVLTRYILRFLTGHRLTDTQTGLRGIPMDLVPALLKIRSMGYAFEMDMIVNSLQSGRRIKEIGIETVYEDGNRSSHFNPVLDSMRVYFVFIRFTSVSLLSALIDNIIFLIAFHQTENILASQTIGRVISVAFNYFMNKNAVFHSRATPARTLPGYLLLAATILLGSNAIIRVSVSLWRMNILILKIISETSLFFISFFVQRAIFSNREFRTKEVASGMTGEEGSSGAIENR